MNEKRPTARFRVLAMMLAYHLGDRAAILLAQIVHSSPVDDHRELPTNGVVGLHGFPTPILLLPGEFIHYFLTPIQGSHLHIHDPGIHSRALAIGLISGDPENLACRLEGSAVLPRRPPRETRPFPVDNGWSIPS